ncbi:hypothetical protein SDC9_152015 [bioreactor metagenome]|uniref:Uncharacterized protein n=1 Tax=bioreactor metagenome TaxID=1076179 RepID=A0A645ERX2_9ZZZZ
MQGEQFLAADKLFPVVFLKLFHLILLAGKGFHHTHPGQVFLQGGGKYRFLLLIRLIGCGDLLKEQDGDQQHKRHNDNGDERQFDVQIKQGDEVDYKEQGDPTNADSLVGKETTQSIYIRSTAFDQLTGLGLGMIGERKVLDLVVQVITQSAGDPFSGL